MKYCIYCGQKNEDEAEFCFSCGKAMHKSSETDEGIFEHEVEKEHKAFTCECVADKSEANPKKKVLKSVFSIVRSSIVLAIAILMVISLFLPMYNVVPTDNALNVDINIYSWDVVGYFFDGFEESVSYELLEDEYDIRSNIKEMMKQDSYEESDEYAETVEKLFKNLLKQQYQGRQDVFTPMFVTAVVFVVVRFLLVVAFLVFAILGFVNSFEKIKFGNGRVERVSLRLFLYSILSVVVGAFVFDPLSIGISSIETVKIDSSAIWIIILLSLTIIGFIIATKIIQKRFGSVKRFVLALVSSTMCILTVVFAFSPVFVTKAKVPVYSDNSLESLGETERESYRSIEIKHKASFFENFFLSDEEINKYTEFIEKDKGKYEVVLSSYKKYSSYSSSRYESIDTEIIMYAVNSQNNFLENSWGFSFFGIVYLIIIIAALLILSENLMYLLTEKSLKITVLISKITIPIFCSIALATVIILMLIVNFKLDFWLNYYDLKISAGIIAMIIFAIALICIPRGKIKNV